MIIWHEASPTREMPLNTSPIMGDPCPIFAGMALPGNNWHYLQSKERIGSLGFARELLTAPGNDPSIVRAPLDRSCAPRDGCTFVLQCAAASVGCGAGRSTASSKKSRLSVYSHALPICPQRSRSRNIQVGRGTCRK